MDKMLMAEQAELHNLFTEVLVHTDMEAVEVTRLLQLLEAAVLSQDRVAETEAAVAQIIMDQIEILLDLEAAERVDILEMVALVLKVETYLVA